MSGNLYVTRKLIKFHNDRTAKLSIATRDIETRQKVTEDAWYWLQLCASEVAAVYRTRRLTIQPIVDARRTECMLAICRLATSVHNKTFTTIHRHTVGHYGDDLWPSQLPD